MISYLEDFMVGLLNYLKINKEPTEENNNEIQENNFLNLETIAEFIHSNRYRGE